LSNLNGNKTIARLFIFAFDLNEASQIRRIKSFVALGHDVATASFRRANMNSGFTPDWPNTDLGEVRNRQFAGRLLRLGAAFFRVLGGAPGLRQADAIIARNFDLLALAWLARLIRGRRGTPLIYECLDIHGLFTRPGIVGRTMRLLERFLLRRVQLVIVSSPGFVTEYFEKIQHHEGPFAIVENKLWFDGPALTRPRAPAPVMPDGRIRLGWVGSIRCAASLKLLAEVAARMSDRLTIEISGNVHRHALPDFDAVLAANPNMTYHGPYAYPQGLERVYGGCDLVWAQDLWQRGANSDWLLPNRIYEASWFGCPSVAVAATQTGRRVQEAGLGFVIEAPGADELQRLLDGVRPEDIRARSQAILRMDDADFRLSEAELAAPLERVLGG